MRREQTVAVLGTGTMGRPIAANIAEVGFDLRVWNRSREKAEPLRDNGAVVCDSPAEAAAGADFVLTMLFDSDAVVGAMAGDDGALGGMSEDAVWLQCSTVGLKGCDRLATLAAEARIPFVDAPVLGTRKPAEERELVVLASGPDDVRDRCQPIFEAIGSSVLWLGPAGTGSRLKVVVNNWLLTATEAVAESVALAEACGLEPHFFLDAISGTAVDCAYAHLKGRAMIDRQFEPSFSLEASAKDSTFTLEAAAEVGIALGVAEAVHRDLERAIELGHGEEDLAATYFAHQ